MNECVKILPIGPEEQRCDSPTGVGAGREKVADFFNKKLTQLIDIKRLTARGGHDKADQEQILLILVAAQ
jgi:hypothetical protein